MNADITVEEETKRGERIAEVLKLRFDLGEDYKPARYKTTVGNKTALGIYRLTQRIMEGDEVE